MADTYTGNLHLTKMEQKRTNWGSVINAMLDQLDGYAALGAGNVVPLETPASTTLQVSVRPGVFVKASDGSEVSISGGTLTCVTGVNYVYADATGAIQVNNTGYPAGEIVKLARVTGGASTITAIVDDRRELRTTGINPAAVFVASGASHAPGIVPDPPASAGTSKYLREDATWAVIPSMVASGATHSGGLVPDPGVTAGTTKFLRENATWAVPPTFVASGASNAAGYVPAPGSTAGTRKFLREDATWVAVTTMVASGGSHAGGLVPDPGAVAGTSKYLREDATWVSPGGVVAGTFTQAAGTAAISSTTLISHPSGSALYEVSIYATIAVNGTSGNLVLTMVWADASGGSRTVNVVTLDITTFGYAVNKVLVQCTNTQNVTFSLSFSGTPGAVVYSLYMAYSKLY